MLVAACAIAVLGATSAQALGAVTADTDSLKFSTAVGASQTKSVTLSNASPVVDLAASVTPDASPFEITDDKCSPSIAENKDCKIMVTFTPGAVGKHTGSLEFGTEALKAISLTGTGEGPRASISPASLAFTAPSGTTSAPDKVTLKNTGDRQLKDIKALTSASFRIASDQCSGKVLAPDAGCTVGVVFTPPGEGAVSGALRIASNDPVKPRQDIQLTGTGTAAPAPPPPVAAPPPPPPPPPIVIFRPAPSDRDQDGVIDMADECPDEAGDRTDGGCPRDEDDDGVSDREDRCLGEPGNRRNGCPAQLNADIRGLWRVNRLRSQLLSLAVKTDKGSRIEVLCGRRGGCGFTKRTIRKTGRRVTSLTRYFRGRRILHSRVAIVVRVTRPQHIGTYESLRTRRGRRLPKVTQRCLKAGTRTKIRRC